MLTNKTLRYFVLPVLLSLTFCKARAQNLDEKTYVHKMRLIDSLSFRKMQDFDTLYKVSIKDDVENYSEDFYGWISARDKEGTGILTINGTELKIERKLIIGIKPLPLDKETIDSLISWERKEIFFNMENFAVDNLLILWLYEKGKEDYSKQFLPKRQTFFADSDMMQGFGALYYDAMLQAFSYERNYPKAIALTSQLKNHSEDFKTFRTPDSLLWLSLKKKLTRKE